MNIAIIISSIILFTIYGIVANRNENHDEGNLPSIFIVGAQKGGSSSLYELMVQHPLLCGGKYKEPQFFHGSSYIEKGVAFYKQLFTKCGTKKGIRYIDGTPILHQDFMGTRKADKTVWERIYETYGENISLRDNLKFIVLLREPISRDFSRYQHDIRNLLEGGLLFKDIETIGEMNRDPAYYIHQLMRFTAVFKRKQIMIISSADLFVNTASVMERIRKFIDVPKDSSFNTKLPHDDHIETRYEEDSKFKQCIIDHVPPLDCSERDRLGALYEPFNQQLYEYIQKSKNSADPNEGPFWPLFDSYKTINCSTTSRKELDNVIQKDKTESCKSKIYHYHQEET